ncbi:hypothetical protein OFY17_12475 [Marinomonas sp. C2222]|uniref:Uncharacterized protein n=1 Tax=Marinomonas sargassi TaxID=2984494 RepID=A0ABT2YUY2_9GAMM|nr:hypothetical protein [Marinomonas sargassi]MCV2403688.1 hypothetical protein [Marinomonas sargassi]
MSNQTEANANSNSERYPDVVQLSDRAKSLVISQNQEELEKSKEEETAGKESVQVSSSIGRLSRITGLQRDEVAALYRSIDKLT